MRNGRILLVCSEFPPGPGGIGFHAFSLASALHGLGKSVNVLSNADYAEGWRSADFDARQPFAVRRFRRKGFLTPFLRVLDAWKVLSEVRPSHVITTGKFPIWMLPVVAMHPSRPRRHCIVHGHETIMGSWPQKIATSLAIRFAHCLYPVSRFSAGSLPTGLKSKRQVKVIPNGIDTASLKGYKRAKEKGILEGDPVLITVGHTSPRKGQHRVIKALPSLIRKYPDIVYHILGRDVNNDGLRALAAQLGVSHSVRFHPPVYPHEELGTAYSSADLFMLLSENQPDGDVEGFGIVALEANYFGTPVIGAKGCGVEDAVSHRLSGYLVDGNDADEIVEAVTYLLEHPETRESSVEWSLKHDWSEIVKLFLPYLD
jgi:phosphatidylinositol alpha-1,6-mannosyltransferase